MYGEKMAMLKSGADDGSSVEASDERFVTYGGTRGLTKKKWPCNRPSVPTTLPGDATVGDPNLSTNM